MQRWFLHWNFLGQAVGDRVSESLVSDRLLAAARESLTVAGVDGFELRLKASVHVGKVGGEGHFHFVGAAGFRHRPVRLFSTHSDWQDTPSVTHPLTHPFVCSFMVNESINQ